jgi:hypothetical protein
MKIRHIMGLSELNHNHKIVFYDSHVSPYKPENIYNCKSKITFENDSYLIINVQIFLDDGTINNLFLTYINEDFLRGYLYKNNQEYEVLFYGRYSELTIDNNVYNNIATCKLHTIIQNEISP